MKADSAMAEKASTEIILQGIAAAKGMALGNIALLGVKNKLIEPLPITKKAVPKELERFLEARRQLLDEFLILEEEINNQSSREIVDTQRQIVEDPEIETQVNECISGKMLNAEYAVFQAYNMYIERLQESGSDLFRQRIVDLEDVRDRLIAILRGDTGIQTIKKGDILIASEISPADLISYHEQGIAGLILDRGGKTSHAAIIARSLGIPCIVNAKNAVATAGDCRQVIIDGESGHIYFNPAKERQQELKKQLRRNKKWFFQKDSVKDLPSATADGHPFRILANIEFASELKKVRDSKAAGIGLLRTETLLFRSSAGYNAEEQIAFYRTILSGSQGPVTIRLFDVGGDKTHARNVPEANPFLGWRGIRMLLDEQELLRNQLKAIHTVAADFPGRINILVPMVTVIEEVRKIRAVIESVQAELNSSGIKLEEQLPLGLMVEVPGVALLAYQFAQEVDFFSVGTNDLTQYALAVDRGNERISSLFQHYHPSVLRLIQLTVEGAEKAGIDVRVCGELAGCEIGAVCLFGMGINELSMQSFSIPEIKHLLTSRVKSDFEKFAARAIEAATSGEVEEIFNNWKKH